MDETTIKEEAAFTVKAFQYITEHHLDVNNQDDVVKALVALNAKRTDNEYVSALIPVLGIVKNMIDKEADYNKAQEAVEESMKILK